MQKTKQYLKEAREQLFEAQKQLSEYILSASIKTEAQDLIPEPPYIVTLQAA